jgi:hypothetical protein
MPLAPGIRAGQHLPGSGHPTCRRHAGSAHVSRSGSGAANQARAQNPQTQSRGRSQPDRHQPNEPSVSEIGAGSNATLGDAHRQRDAK